MQNEKMSELQTPEETPNTSRGASMPPMIGGTEGGNRGTAVGIGHNANSIGSHSQGTSWNNGRNRRSSGGNHAGQPYQTIARDFKGETEELGAVLAL